MDLFPQSSTQAAGVTDGHGNNRRGTVLISTDGEEEEEESMSQEVVIISDDGSEDDPTSTKEGSGSHQRRRRRSVSRRRWTLSEDCMLVEAVASHRQKFLWKTIAPGFPQRTRNSCRLRWIKLFKLEDTFTDNRWSEMALLVGNRVMNKWRLMIAQNNPNFYMFISANHPLKRLCVQNVGSMTTDPFVGGDNNGVGDTTNVLSTASGPPSSVVPCIDLNLSLANGHNQNSTIVAATTT